MGVNVNKAEHVNYIRQAHKFIGIVISTINKSQGKLSDNEYKSMFDAARSVVSSNLNITSSLMRLLDGVQTVPIVVGKKYVVRFQYDGGQITKINIYDKESNKVIKIHRQMINSNGRGRVNYNIETDRFQVIQGIKTA